MLELDRVERYFQRFKRLEAYLAEIRAALGIKGATQAETLQRIAELLRDAKGRE